MLHMNDTNEISTVKFSNLFECSSDIVGAKRKTNSIREINGKSERVEKCMQDIFLMLETAPLLQHHRHQRYASSPRLIFRNCFLYWRINQIAKSKEQIAVVHELGTYAKGGEQNNKTIQNFNWMTITMWLRTREIRIHHRIHRNKYWRRSSLQSSASAFARQTAQSIGMQLRLFTLSIHLFARRSTPFVCSIALATEVNASPIFRSF